MKLLSRNSTFVIYNDLLNNSEAIKSIVRNFPNIIIKYDFKSSSDYKFIEFYKDGKLSKLIYFVSEDKKEYFYFKDGLYHREDGPAIIRDDCVRYMMYGKRHRVNGPAIIYKEHVEYWIEDKLHRIDGPAIVSKDSEYYYVNGLLHREDGPALIEGAHKAYYIKGKLHREDGPAAIWENADGYSCKYSYYKNGLLHREDGPAYITGNGNETYYLNGKEITKNELWAINNDMTIFI